MQRFQSIKLAIQNRLTPESLKDNERYAKIVYSIVGAILISFFFQYAIPEESRLNYSIGVLPILFAALLFILLNRTFGFILSWFKSSKKEVILTMLLALVLSSFLVLGAWILPVNVKVQMTWEMIASIFTCAYLFLVLFALLWKGLDRLSNVSTSEKANKVTVRWCLCIFLVISICWIPYLLAAWPGFSVTDAYVEWQKYVDGQEIAIDYIGHTLFMGFLIELGTDLFGNPNAGQALFTITQATIINIVFVAMLAWMKRNNAPKVLLYASVLYIALNPIIAATVMCSVKDIIYSAVLLLVCILLYSFLNNSPMVKKSSYALLAGLLLAILALCLFRGNGRYVIIPGLILIALFASPKKKLPLVGVALIVAAFFAIAPSFLSHPDDSETEEQHSDGVSAVFCVPVQQLAYVSYSDLLSSAETEYLERIGYKKPSIFYENIADFTMKEMSLSTKQFLKAYVKIGLKHPYDYFVAACKLTQDAWNPYSYVDAYNANNKSYMSKETSFFGFYTAPPAEADSKNPELLRTIKDFSVNLVFQKIPFLALIISIPSMIILLLITFARTIITKNKGGMAIAILLLLASLTAILGPCILGRYFLYLFYGLPLVLFCLFDMPKNRSTNS